MLEHPSLWLSALTQAWSAPAVGVRGPVRLVLSADSQMLLGHLAFTPRRWWQWFHGPGFAAYEQPDASLVFTARRLGWLGGTLAVADADNRPVAVVYGAYVLSPAGAFWAYHQPGSHGTAGQLLSPAGEELARWEASGPGIVLRYLPAVREEPFLKMGILAAVAAR